MRFSLDVMRARKGDCLMLHYGTQAQPRLMMIDGGPSNVYKPHLKPRIEQVRRARGLDDADALPVDVLMVSHVDDDHIKGILDLARELREQKDAQQPLLVRVDSLWHNTFDDLLDTTPAQLKVVAGFGAAALGGEIEIAGGEEFDTAKVLVSIPQGRDLRDAAALLKWKVNKGFKGKLIMAAKGAKPVELPGGLKLTVIGPLQPELKALQKAHDDWLKKKKKTPEAALAAFSDKSVPNLSSLVFVAEAGGKRMLLTGDARGDKILAGLKLTGLLGAAASSKMHVDVLKVPHHGSSNNMETAFFKRVTASHYVFSGDGEHGNPERETVEMLFKARGKAPYTMHFTYPIDEIDAGRKADWEKERAREIAEGKANPRPVWSAQKHSLKALFQAHPLAAGQKISFIKDIDDVHVIDLLDAVGF